MSLRVGSRIVFHEYTGTTWRGVVTAMRPNEIYVKYTDGVIGIFDRKYTNLLEVVS